MSSDPFAFRAGRFINQIPSKIKEIEDTNAQRAAEEEAFRTENTQRLLASLKGAGQNFVSGLTGGEPVAPPTMLNPLQDPHGALMALGARQKEKPRDVLGEQIRSVATRPAPTPQPGSIESMKPGPQVEQDPIDRMYSEYLKNPRGFEANRMAAPPTSGELRYSINGSPMQSYNVGANRTDVMGDPNFSGHGGAVSTPGGQDDEAYRRYRENLYGPEVVAAQEADVARNRMLAEDPFAEQNSQLLRQMQLSQANAQFGAQRDAAKQQNTLDTLDGIEREARQMIQEIQSETVDPNYRTPEQKAAAIEKVQQWLESRQAALGVRQRLDGSV